MFTNYPNIVYQNGGDKKRVIKDYYFRVDFLYNYMEKNLQYFTQYVVNDFETPESLSLRYYRDRKYWFLILMINKRYDPYYDWVLTNDELLAYAEKYVTENYSKVRDYLLQSPEILAELSETFGFVITDYTPTIATDKDNTIVSYIISHYFTELGLENDIRRKIFLPSMNEMIRLYNAYIKYTSEFK
jgi:hypothetical protein